MLFVHYTFKQSTSMYGYFLRIMRHMHGLYQAERYVAP